VSVPVFLLEVHSFRNKSGIRIEYNGTDFMELAIVWWFQPGSW